MWFQRTRRASGPNPDAALQDARKNLKKVVDRTPEVTAIADASRTFRTQNHFAIDLQALFEGGRR